MNKDPRRKSGLFGAGGLALALALSSQASAETYRLGVDGLACPLCTFGIEKQLKKLAGVTVVKTDLASSTVIVTTPVGKTLERSALEGAVKRAGFKVRSFIVAPSDNEVGS